MPLDSLGVVQRVTTKTPKERLTEAVRHVVKALGAHIAALRNRR